MEGSDAVNAKETGGAEVRAAAAAGVVGSTLICKGSTEADAVAGVCHVEVAADGAGVLHAEVDAEVCSLCRGSRTGGGAALDHCVL